MCSNMSHFAQKCLEMRENKQNVVLNQSSETFGNRSDFLLAMTTVGDGASGSNFVR